MGACGLGSGEHAGASVGRALGSIREQVCDGGSLMGVCGLGSGSMQGISRAGPLGMRGSGVCDEGSSESGRALFCKLEQKRN